MGERQDARVASPSEEVRLLFWADHQETPKAFVYAADANAYSAPVAWFEPEPYQVIPRVEPGVLVRAEGRLATGERPTFVFPDGTMVLPPEKLRPGGDAPLFAERWSGCVHPHYESRQANWQRAPSVPATVSEWDQRVRHLYRRSVWWIVSACVFVALLVTIAVLSLVLGDGILRLHIGYYYGGGASGIGAVASLRKARAERRAAERASILRSRPSTPMYLRLWWSLGDGWGRVPVASLSLDASGSRAVHVPLSVVPRGYDPFGAVPVQVHGSIDERDPVVIRDGDVELWPAGDASAALRGHRRRRGS
jgi:hypothetical protein